MSRGHVNDELVNVLLDGAPQDDAAEVERHLGSCAECRAALDRLRALSEVMTSAPLEPLPPPALQEEVFVRIRHSRTTELLEAAPLASEPDPRLADRVFSDERLDKVVSIDSARKRPTLVRGLLMAGAAALVIALGFSVTQMMALNDEVDELTNQSSNVALGHPVQVVALSGEGVSADLELVHFRHDNYRLQLITKDFPIQQDGHHYEVWLEGEGGATIAGSFRIERPDEVTFIFNVGIDPSEYTRVEIVEEPDHGPATRDGKVIVGGAIDPDHVDHVGEK